MQYTKNLKAAAELTTEEIEQLKNGLYDKALPRLTKKLLAMGGTRIVARKDFSNPINMMRSDIEGKIYDYPAKRVWGQRSDCHGNSERYVSRTKNCVVMTGFALSDDGLWREHSWVFNKKKHHILETTVERVKYFGYENQREEVEK